GSPGPVASLEASSDGEQALEDHEQVRLRGWTVVRHRDSQQHLALALRVADRSAAGRDLGPPDFSGELSALIDEPDEATVQRVDPPPQSAQLRRFAGPPVSHGRRAANAPRST